MEKCQDLRKEASQLKPPAQQRKAALDLSLQFHEFNFDLQRELEWIAEKITIISGRPFIQLLVLIIFLQLPWIFRHCSRLKVVIRSTRSWRRR